MAQQLTGPYGLVGACTGSHAPLLPCRRAPLSAAVSPATVARQCTQRAQHAQRAQHGGLQRCASGRCMVGTRRWAHAGRCRAAAGSAAAEAPARTFPETVPPQVSEIQEPAALDMAAAIQTCQLEIPSWPGTPIRTAYVGPAAPATVARPALRPSAAGNGAAQAAPLVLLHGFDSSLLEFRRLHPLLAEQRDTWSVDLVGWGFSDACCAGRPERPLGPQQKREHLYAFWKEKVRRPMVLLGVSLGGAIAMDFALAHPEAVEKLVLVDSQGFIDGLGRMSTMPRLVSSLGVSILKTVPLRQMANRMAYYNQRLATDDALRCGRLHCFVPGWQEANIAFMRSGGYSLSARVRDVAQPALVVWGRQDKILDPAYATRFQEELPNARLEWFDDCGHCAHLEQAPCLAEATLAFAAESSHDS